MRLFNPRLRSAPVYLPRLFASAFCLIGLFTAFPLVSMAQTAVFLDQGKLRIEDSSLATSDLTVTGSAPNVTVLAGTGNTVTAGSGVSQITASVVVLPLSSITDGIAIDLGAGGSDSITLEGAIDFSGTANGIEIINVESITHDADVELGIGDAVYEAGASGRIDIALNSSLAATSGAIRLSGDRLFNLAALGSAAMSGDILLNFDEASLSTGTVRTDGDLAIATFTVGRDIELGGAKNSAFLGLNSSDLDSLQNGFNQIIIGDANTGTLTLGSYDFADDTQLNAEVFVQNGTVNMGGDSLTVNAGDRIEMTGTASLNSGSGDLTLNATQSTSPRAIELDGASILSNSGTISLNGQAEGANALHGIVIDGGTQIISATSAAILLNGEVRNSALSPQGLLMDDDANIIQSLGSGQISLTGSVTDCPGASAACGIFIVQNNTVQATGSGDVTLTGTVSSDNVPSNFGIQFGSSSPSPRSTGIVANDGDIIVNGAASGATSGNIGVYFQIFGTLQTTGTGDVRVTGSATNDLDAIFFASEAQTWMETSHVDAHITLTTASGLIGIGGGTIGSATMPGDIRFFTDNFNLTSGSVRTGGALEIATFTPGRDMALGGAGTSTGLILDSSELDALQSGSGPITFGDDNTGTLTLGSYDFSEDTQLNAEIIEANGSVDMGDNALTLNAGERIKLTSTASLSSASGDLTLNATDSTSAIAILLDGAEIQSISGTIFLNGQSEGTNAVLGIMLKGGTEITSFTSAPIFLNGEVRNSQQIVTRGLEMNASPNVIRSLGSGQISLSGSVSDSPNINFAVGLLIDQTNTVQATDAEDIVLTGTATSDNVSTNRGIQLGNSAAAPSSTGIESKDGAIVVNGSASGTGSGNEGVLVFANASLRTTGSGNVEMTGSVDSLADFAIYFFNNGAQAFMETSHADADITLTATKGRVGLDGGVIGSATMQGDIALITDGVGPSAVRTELRSEGDLQIEPRTSDTVINLGNGNTNDLALTDSFIGRWQDGFNQIVIGDPVKTSTVSIGSVDLDDSLVVIGSEIDVERIASPGNSVTLDAANEITLENSAGNFVAEEFIIDGTLTFPNDQLDFERTFDSDLTLVASNSFDAKLDDGSPVASQRLRLTSGKTLTLNNADLLLDASSVSGIPAVGDVIPLITIEGSNPIAGNFGGRLEGSYATIAGQNFRLSYEGGDGNDVTLVATDEPGVRAAVLSSGLDASGNSFTVEASLASYQFATTRSFQLYRTTDLTAPFLPLGGTTVSVDHFSQLAFTDPSPPAGQAFYQIRALPED